MIQTYAQRLQQVISIAGPEWYKQYIITRSSRGRHHDMWVIYKITPVGV